MFDVKKVRKVPECFCGYVPKSKMDLFRHMSSSHTKWEIIEFIKEM